jgi:nucleoside-diphosphate-sugar epimerase
MPSQIACAQQEGVVMAFNPERPILVTGATGKTGRHTVRLLSTRGLAVRSLVHRGGRAERLAAMGTEVAIIDIHDLEALMQQCEKYFLHSIPDSRRVADARILSNT